ncbi:hypothetical protein ACJMK2_000343 [Sinanodonta woodiana]|uniref:Uncharacterized protein n=1 Tax=Sinanodonta woodiana TaxID=1069815 RepID=A0ABD3XRA3_SINWO
MFLNFMRRQCCQFRIDILGMLTEVCQFAGDFIDIDSVLFYGAASGTYKYKFVWNVHHIRPTKNQNSPNGRPVVMYKLSMIYGTRSYLQSVDEDKIEVCRDECVFRDEHPCDRDKNRWTSPTNIDDAMQLYCDIRNMLLVDLRR